MRTTLTEPSLTPRGRSSLRRERSASPSGLRLLLLGGLMALSGYLLSRVMPADQPVLPIAEVRVRGVDDATKLEVLAYAAIQTSDSLVRLDVADVRQRVLEHPFVREARVSRVPPDAVEIEVVPRQAVALVNLGGLYLVDDDGVPFKLARPGDGLDLPVLTGINRRDAILPALHLIDEYRRQGAVAGPVQEVHVSDDGSMALVLDDGVRVLVGDRGLVTRLGILSKVMRGLAQRGLKARTIHIADGRVPERVTVRLRSGSSLGQAQGT